ncbi:uncharacterized protein LOC144362501 [Saccoglossus kowalevskii]
MSPTQEMEFLCTDKGGLLLSRSCRRSMHGVTMCQKRGMRLITRIQSVVMRVTEILLCGTMANLVKAVGLSFRAVVFGKLGTCIQIHTIIIHVHGFIVMIPSMPSNLMIAVNV